ncbi:MAG: squalene--hopene cyclase [Desulfobacteraceae bacterium]|nr:MAG: squalene--hopene cyclase [Desulfobacteraceae bacterium]
MCALWLKRSPESNSFKIDRGIEAAIKWLELRQQPEGFWVGMLESNSCMEAEWILAMHFLGVADDPKYSKVVRSILNEQRPDGSWQTYYDAPQGDINTTVECYAALRAAGLHPDFEPLKRARKWILESGRLNRIRVFTRFWLALIGEWPWEDPPSCPPELIFLPPYFFLNIYEFASWARATIIPLCILSALRPVRPLPPAARLDELFPHGRRNAAVAPPFVAGFFTWKSFFRGIDRLLKAYTHFPWQPGRRLARKRCAAWIVEHQDEDGAWGGIQPPWIYSLMALKTQGFPIDHPVIEKGLRAFDAPWSYEKKGGIHLQASESPVWDTLLVLDSMLDCGSNPEAAPVMRSAIEWILEKQITASGDWAIKVKDVCCGGWAFERANLFYPDIDDTAIAIIVLARARNFFKGPSKIDRALRLATEWMLAMQCANGGWAAFDRNNTNTWVTKLPFLDFGEALDPPSADVTAHVVEALGATGRRMNDPAVRSAVRFIRDEQEPEGSWFGRWGVNHIYGTAAVLPALAAVGEDMEASYVRKAADWIAGRQNPDGGWGETCASYMDDRLKGVGPSTASQTGWALIALLSVDTRRYDGIVLCGVDYLLSTQKEGTWDEPYYTGTGFPGYGVGARADLKRKGSTLEQGTELSRGFMINYNLYRHYFPLMALGRARRHFGKR